MSYKQAMQWGRKHPKGTRQPIIMSTGSGFNPSWGFLSDAYFPYRDLCEEKGIAPLSAFDYYEGTLRGRVMSSMDLDEQVAYTKSQQEAR